jgi:hypothetical protein
VRKSERLGLHNNCLSFLYVHRGSFSCGVELFPQPLTHAKACYAGESKEVRVVSAEHIMQDNPQQGCAPM